MDLDIPMALFVSEEMTEIVKSDASTYHICIGCQPKYSNRTLGKLQWDFFFAVYQGYILSEIIIEL